MNNTEEGISIKELFDIIIKNIILIISITMIFGAVGVALAFTKSPTYQVKTKTLVNINISEGVSSDGITTTLRLLETIEKWFSTELVLDSVQTELASLGYDVVEEYSKKNIRKSMITESSTSNLYVNLYFQDKNIDNAVIIANLIMNIGINLWAKSSELNNSSLNTANTTTFVITDVATKVDAEDVSLSGIMYCFISVLIGGLLSVSFVLVKELSSNKLSTKEQIEKISGMKIIAVIPEFENRGN